MVPYKQARLFDADGDLTKQWYVYFSYIHPETRKFTRFKRSLSMKLRTRVGRHEKGAEIIKSLNFRLKNGWNPFTSAELENSTVIAAIERVIEIKRNILRSRTIHTYDHLARLFIRWIREGHNERMCLPEFSSKHAQAFLDWTKSVQKVQNRTYNNYITHMKVFFNFLIEREYTDFNPFVRIKKLPKDEAEIITFTPAEMQKMREHLPEDNYRLWACAQLIFYCFLRPAEIMRMKPKDIDLDRQMIRVHGYLTKNRQDAVIVIPDPLTEVLTNLHLETLPNDHYIFTKDLLSSEKQAAPTRMAEAWRDWADKYNIDKCIYHLKHTGAGMAVEAGMSVRDLQLQLRHHSLEMTQVYLDKFRRDPGEKIKKHFPVF